MTGSLVLEDVLLDTPCIQVNCVDVGARLDNLVKIATRAEKRFGVVNPGVGVEAMEGVVEWREDAQNSFYGRDGQSLELQGSLDYSGMHQVYVGVDSDDNVENLDGAEDYLSDRQEEEEEEESNIFPGLVVVVVLQHTLVARRRLIFDPLESTSARSRVHPGDVRLTPRLVSKVFKVPYFSMPAKGRKVTDSQMKGEFGNPIGMKACYMVRNASGIRATNLFWYLEKVCILQKTAYMSKEAFAPLFQAERGIKVDWETVLYDRMQLIGKRDRRQTLAVGRVAPYLATIFEHVLKVLSVVAGLKTPVADGFREGLEEPESKLNIFTMESKSKKLESKGKKVMVFLKGIDGAMEKSVPESLKVKEGSSASHETMGIFSVEEAANCLDDLNKFLQNQDAVLRVLESEKLEHKCSTCYFGMGNAKSRDAIT
ncbi:hypothetical protein L7F22_055255 [Adiantum nelumboides]|nr:hypothetical protein [Adiantum nelumboides]